MNKISFFKNVIFPFFSYVLNNVMTSFFFGGGEGVSGGYYKWTSVVTLLLVLVFSFNSSFLVFCQLMKSSITVRQSSFIDTFNKNYIIFIY